VDLEDDGEADCGDVFILTVCDVEVFDLAEEGALQFCSTSRGLTKRVGSGLQDEGGAVESAIRLGNGSFWMRLLYFCSRTFNASRSLTSCMMSALVL